MTVSVDGCNDKRTVDIGVFTVMQMVLEITG